MKPFYVSALTILVIVLFAVLTQCVRVTYWNTSDESSVTFSLIWNGWVIVVLATISAMVYITSQGVRGNSWEVPSLPPTPKLK